MSQPTTNTVAKSCTKCGETKPLTEFSSQAKAKDGRRPDCKTCRSAYMKANYRANRKKRLENVKAYHAANRAKIAATKRAAYLANRDKKLEAAKAYRESNRCKIALADKAYYEANRNKRLEYARERHVTRWANDPGYRELIYAAGVRRKRMLACAVQEPYLRADIFERDGWVCRICDEAIDPQLSWPDSWAASIDHIVPVSLGGDDTPANVQAAHLTCNIRKHNRVGFKIA